MALNIVSINAKGLNHPAKRQALWQEACRLKTDVLCVQETHFANVNPPKCSHHKYSEIFFANAPKKHRGVMLAISNTLRFVQSEVLADPNGRFLILVCTIGSQQYTIVSVYAPNTHQIRFLNKLFKKINELRKGNLVVCGDFNLVVDGTMDSSNPIKRPSLDLQYIMQRELLYDVWRCTHPSERDYTFFSNPHKTYSRIDLFLVDKQLLCNTQKATIHDITWSDHAPISLTIRSNLNKPSTTTWKNNISLMLQAHNKRALETALKNYFDINDTPSNSAFTIWNAHKAVIRGHFIQIGARAKKTRSNKIDSLLTQISTLETQNKQKFDASISVKLKSLRHQLRLLLVEAHEKRELAFKAHFYQYSSKASKYLAARLKPPRKRHTITCLRDPNTGTKHWHPQSIADMFSTYYENLYNIVRDPQAPQPSDSSINKFLDSIHLPSLTEDQISQLNLPITHAEISKTVHSLPNNKSPGPDGFSAEYYKTFLPLLVPSLNKVFSAASQCGSFPLEMLQATIVTIPKEGKDDSLPQNYRPISLLNTDVKIYAKILANRLSVFLPHLIHPDQSGFISSRGASDATRRAINILHYIHQKKVPSIFLALDAEKAFDRINWLYINKVMLKFGFSGWILPAILALYSCPSAAVNAAGSTSKPFQISNGTRQGCPLSPLIFNLSIEPLAAAIRSHPDISGIDIARTKHVINLFADDVLLFLSDPKRSLPALSHLLESFSAISYYKINALKSQLLDWHIDPTTRKSLSETLPYQWNNSEISYLGIKITKHVQSLYDRNYAPLLINISGQINNFPKTFFSWSAKLSAFKMLILPQLLYLFRTLPIPLPCKFFNAINRIMNSYIWNGKRHRCSIAIMSKHRSIGGLGYPVIFDYYVAALLSQLQPWFNPSIHKQWLEIEICFIPKQNRHLFFVHSKLPPDLIKNLSPSTKASLHVWSTFLNRLTAHDNLQEAYIALEALELLSPSLKLDNWTKRGLKFVSDLYVDSSILPFESLCHRFSLPDMERFNYMRINSIIKSWSNLTLSLPPHLFSYLLVNPLPTRGISLCYNLIDNKKEFYRSKNINIWEAALQHRYSAIQWKAAFSANHSATANVELWMLMHKLFLNWYYTPQKLNKIFPESPSACWRNCGCLGTLLHVMWDCPVLSKFWDEIFTKINQITSSMLHKSPDMALLSLGIETIPKRERNLVTHILLAARLTITRNWKQPLAPIADDVYSLVDLHKKLERISAIKLNRIPQYEISWQLWC